MNRISSLLGLLLLIGLAGCTGGVKTTTVSGKVTVDGQPVTEGNVSFLPVGKETKAGLCVGQIDSGGNYKIFTDGKEGAPEGKYKVTVTRSMMPSSGTTKPSTPFNSKYSNVNTTPLTIDVPSGNYDLKLDK
jgi:hypothetical protein